MRMFAQWATRRLVKFLLKKRLGRYIKGDLDLEQLDVQLRSGVAQLNDLALNTDYINRQLADMSVMLKEGSLGSVTMKLHWNATIEFEVDELELVFSPRKESENEGLTNNSTSSGGGTSAEGHQAAGMEYELASSRDCTYVPVQEGVRVVANLVENLLLGMHVKIRGAIVAFEEQPSLEESSAPQGCQSQNSPFSYTMLALRVGYIEYGVDYSSDSMETDQREEMPRVKSAILTKDVKVKDMTMELLSIGREKTGGNKVYSQPVSILPYENRLSGCIRLSIPWKCGCLEFPKLNADIDISDVKLRITGLQIQQLLNIARSFGNHGTFSKSSQATEVNQSSSWYHSLAPEKPEAASGSAAEVTAVASQSLFERHGLLPGSKLISNWVHWNDEGHQSREETMSEADFTASTEEFFDCFDGTRSSQMSVNGSGLWSWTFSAFSAITAASSLASGSVVLSQDPARQVEYDFKVKISSISIEVLEQELQSGNSVGLDITTATTSKVGGDNPGDVGFNMNTAMMHPDCLRENYIEVCFSDVQFSLQISRKQSECQFLVKKIAFFEVQHEGSNISPFNNEYFHRKVKSADSYLQAMVEKALPNFSVSLTDKNSHEKQDEHINNTRPLSNVALSTTRSASNTPKKKCFLRLSNMGHIPAGQIIVRTEGTLSMDSGRGSQFQGHTHIEIFMQPLIFWLEVPILERVCKLCEFTAGIATRESNMGSVEKFNPEFGTRKSIKDIDVYIPQLRLLACVPLVPGSSLLQDDILCLDLSTTTGNAKRQLLSVQIYHVPRKKANSLCDFSISFAVENSSLYLVSPLADDQNFTLLDFNAHRVFRMSVHNNRMGTVDMFCQGKSPRGTQLIRRIWGGVKEHQKGRTGAGSPEFAAATATEVLDETGCRIREEITLCSSMHMHVTLPPLKLELFGTRHLDVLGLISYLMEALCFQNGQSTVEGLSDIKRPSLEQQDNGQTSVCITVEEIELMVHSLLNDEMTSLESEKKVNISWDRFRILVTGLQVLYASNMGRIKHAAYLWVYSGSGHITGWQVGDSSEELLLLTCRDNALGRGDGGGGNALATNSAGIEVIVAMWPPDELHSEDMLITAAVRGGTFMAHGGQLDWLPGLLTIFDQIPAKRHKRRAIYENPGSVATETVLVKLQDGSPETTDVPVDKTVLFSLDLHDVALCYEPGKEALAAANIRLRGLTEAQAIAMEQFNPVACALAAAAVRVSSNAISSTPDKVYRIRIRDVALLLVDTTLRTHNIKDYIPDSLHEAGYVKVAQAAVMEAVVRISNEVPVQISDEKRLQWEVECAKNQLRLETCHDTSAALGRLIAQLQQLFAPNIEHPSVDRKFDPEVEVGFPDEEHFVGILRERQSNTNNNNTVISVDMLEDTVIFDREGTIEEKGNSLPSEAKRDSLLERLEVLRRSSSSTDDSEASICSSTDYMCGDGEVKDFWTPVSQNDGSSSFMEDHYVTSRTSVYSSQSSSCKDSNGVLEYSQNSTDSFKMMDTAEGGGGWYDGHTLTIIENHVPEASTSGSKQPRDNLSPLPTTGLLSQACYPPSVGRVVLQDLNLRWRLYGGSDWPIINLQSYSGCTQMSQVQGGRNLGVCLEVILNGVELQHNTYPETGLYASRLSVCVRDVRVYDCSKDAPWKMVLCHHKSKSRRRGLYTEVLKLELESVRPNPLVPLEEYRLSVHLFPLLLHLDQRHLEFLVSFFASSATSSDQHLYSGYEEIFLPTFDGSEGSFETRVVDVCEQAILPFFQMCELQPFTIRVDYVPRRVDIAALRGGNYAELFNLVSWKGIELQLKHVYTAGVHGWGTLSGIVVGEWLEDISHNQIHKLLKGVGPIRPLFAVGSGAAKLIVLPAEHYKRDRRHLLRGMKKGALAFLRSISVETLGVGVKLAAGAQGILLHTESALGTVTLPTPLTSDRVELSNKVGQPGDVREGLQQACESLARGLERTVSSLIGNPLKVYQRGAGTSSAVASALRAAPAAAVAPAAAAAGAVHCALLGARNSLDPEHRRESEEKHSGPPPE